VIGAEAHPVLDSHAVTVAWPARMVAGTVIPLAKVPWDVAVTVKLWLVPPWETVMVTVLPAPKCTPLTVIDRARSVTWFGDTEIEGGGGGGGVGLGRGLGLGLGKGLGLGLGAW
jgi:hypothetical protein